MAVYNPASLKAEEFINDGEIRETLAYAEANKNNIELIDRILEKARPKKGEKGWVCSGLTHREASVLLACEIPGKIEEIYKIAEEIKMAYYGNRIVIFAPLYLSNYCVNGCLYCPYHLKNKHIARKKLTQDEVRSEVIALQDMGHKRLAIEAGEDPVNNPIEYILDCIKTIYSVHHKNGDIRRVNVNIAATTVENYRKLKEAGISSFRKRITKRVTKSSIRRGLSTITTTTQRRWTARWRAESTTWDWASCSVLSFTATSSPDS